MFTGSGRETGGGEGMMILLLISYGLTCHLARLSIFLLLLSLLPFHLSCNQDERDSLLSFLSNLSSTSPEALSLWKTQDDMDCCKWEGITCDGNGFINRVWLPLKGLKGDLSPSLASLVHLRELNLSHNSLSGSFPHELLWSENIVVIDVSFNRLSGKLLEVKSVAVGSSLQLQSLNLSGNMFNGAFPSIWEFAPELTEVNSSHNSFSGTINSSACTSGKLQTLDFSHNQFTGNLPQGLGKCTHLKVLLVGFNNLSGLLPPDLGVVSLEKLSFSSNKISGTLDGQWISNLTNLVMLDISHNCLTGELPESIGKLRNLEGLLLHGNQLEGTLPSAIGNCTRLKCLNLRENNFTGEISTIDFSALPKLQILDLGNNNFSGNLPDSIYSCKSLVALRLAKNSLQGIITRGILNLEHLSFLSLSGNNLTDAKGAFQILKNCKNLTAIVLSTNFYNENIPDDFRDGVNGFQKLKVLALANCNMKGQVPSWIAKLAKLEVLDLSLNQLTGMVPSWLGSLPHLFYLDMSENLLSGNLPLELTKLHVLVSEAATEVNRSILELPVFLNFGGNTTNLQYNQLSSLPPALLLKHNNLNGSIPKEIGLLKMLYRLDLSSNNFSGVIPEQICNLTNLEMLNLSSNHLSGNIPKGLENLHFLSYFNVANNELWGLIPSGGQFSTFPSSSYEGNHGLCGPPLRLMCNSTTEPKAAHPSSIKHPNKLILAGVIFSICFAGVLAFIVLITYILSKGRGRHTDEVGRIQKVDRYITSNSMIPRISFDDADNNSSVILFPDNCKLKKITMPEILKATNNFSEAQIVGCGGFGLVYKAILPDGTKLAIKRLSGEMGVMEREFQAEVEALSTASHKNLVSLQGYSMHGDFRLLLYEYMENGSLDYWLHERADGGSKLSWPIRLRIAQGASQGLSYIHQICQPHIVHRDIKSSNILLDENFEAHVADFGLSRLILPTNTHVTTELVGTLGYIPPEYGQSWVATLKGDIYSFGVVLLELLTGRRPLEIFMPKQSRELVSWVQQMHSQGQQKEIFDPLLRDKGFENQMLRVLEIARLCVNYNPLKRPRIKEVVDWLDTVTDNPQVPKKL